MAIVKTATVARQGWPLFLYTTLALSLVPTSEAQSFLCDQVKQAFPNCDCREAVNDQGLETLDVILDCSNRALTDVPAIAGSLPETLVLHEFRLGNNRITSLGRASFQGIKTRALDLSGNSLSSVHPDALAPLVAELHELQMDGDLNSSPNASALINLSSIEILVLRNFNVQFLGDVDHLYFLGMPNLKHLTLHGWSIEAIEPAAFHGPRSLHSLTLTQQQSLNALPLGVLREDSLNSLTFLKISGTPIAEVTDSAFETLTNLRELDLSENHIKNLKLDCFKFLGPSLKKLSLFLNFLDSEISEMDGLRNLPNLEELDLSENENINAFPDLSQLNIAEQSSVKVLLYKNKIQSLPANAFAGIANKLHTLDLSKNSISSMNSASFNGVTNLQELHLSEQEGLTGRTLTLPQSIAQSASSLTHLFLNGQNLDESTLWSILSNMENLEIVELSNTGLSRIPDLALQKMTALRDLYLTGNSLTSLRQASLVGPRSTLKTLHLSQNPLASIPSCIFDGYNSFPITMALKDTPLNCDCALGWLLNTANQGNIQFIDGHAPMCRNLNNDPLLSKSYNEICSNNDYSDDDCVNFYTTPAPDTTPAPPTLILTLDKISSDSITLSWQLSDKTSLRGFTVKISSAYSSGYERENLPPRTFQVIASPLLPDTQHSVCVIAKFETINSVTSCTMTRTLLGEPNDQKQTSSSNSEDLGIVIGAVVGALCLLLVLGAIAYLVFIRRRPKKGAGTISTPVQPRNFAKSELPSMTEDSRTFTRPKQSVDQHDGMQVVAISNGQFNNSHASNGSARVGRATMLHSDGSYKLMSAGNSSIGATSTGSTSESQSVYENDRGLLPKTPPYYDRGLRGPQQPGYYNEAFEKDKYDEIGTYREASV
ncbi:leucine-rich repeat-containing protein 15-like [Plakobranchus ocellatus]|uniref:Leucine-rich repeat-containing protein 15-like n=1 Tax=Plakobranchus ocellatus TaxID=259542 RepID=A0AAV4C3Q8_9GAST|nr:leucine-rich repeat-containing protein 15-like [Plakobranchus ocellatus]